MRIKCVYSLLVASYLVCIANLCTANIANTVFASSISCTAFIQKQVLPNMVDWTYSGPLTGGQGVAVLSAVLEGVLLIVCSFLHFQVD